MASTRETSLYTSVYTGDSLTIQHFIKGSITHLMSQRCSALFREKGEQLIIFDLGSPAVISVREVHYAAISGKLFLHLMAIMVKKGTRMKAKAHIFKPMSTIATLK